MRNTKLILSILGLIAIGFIAGFFTHRQVAIKKITHVRELAGPSGFERHLFRMIQPTEEQKVQLEPIVGEYSGKMSDLIRTHRRDRKALIDSLHEEIRPILTGEQLHRLQQFEERFRARREKQKRKNSETRRQREKQDE